MTQARNIIDLSEDDLEDLKYGDGGDKFEIVKKSGWSAEGKMQYRSIVFKFKNVTFANASTFWEWCESRSGSEFTDYHYESDDYATQVFKKVVEVVVYE